MLGHPAAPVIAKRLRDELTDVFTYTPGEPDKYFAQSTRLGGLIGFRCGFGSHRFNDHHFHYGYYVYAAAILGLADSGFLSSHGEMAKLVAKEYANWDRDDKRFPLLRTFDIWEGHSWANGGVDNSPWFGQNQESTSEAMMSWAAIVLLGNATGDPAMTAAGAMGHAMEAAATNEYWFNRHHDNFPPSYGPPGRISCITWGSQIQYITYFGPEPVFVHGIQYLPILPSSHYLVRHEAAAAEEFRYLLANSRSTAYTRFATRDSWDVQWANEVMRYAAMVDSDWADNWFEELWHKGDAKAKDPWEAGLTYYLIHANRSLGHPCQDAFVDTPDSGVFLDPSSRRLTAFAYNPTGTPRTYRVRRHGTTIGTLTVPARGAHAIRLEDRPKDSP
jgi:endoglucanase Acf2